MFDPTALLPLVHLTGTVILKANNFVQKAKHVDKFLTGISNEVVCFQNVLRTLETKYVESDIGTKQIDDEPLRRLEADQWAAVDSIVRFSTVTLKEVQSLVEEITQKPAAFLSNLRMRKVALQARVQERGKILDIRRQEIANYRQVLETALISIAVSTNARNGQYSQVFITKLDELSAQIRMLQQNLRPSPEHNLAAFEAMRRYARSTKEFEKRANTVGGRSSLGGTGTTLQPHVWEGAPTLNREDLDQITSQGSRRASTVPAPEGGGPPLSGDKIWNYRLENLPKKAREAQRAYDARKLDEARTQYDKLFQESKELLGENFDNRDQLLEKRAAIYCRQQLWSEAEKILEERFEGWQTAITRLALSYFRHEQWDEAEKVLAIPDIPSSDLIHSKKYLLCEIYYGQKRFDQAQSSCETLIREVIKAEGRDHVMTHMCVKLLVKIFLANGKSEEAAYTAEDLPVELEDCEKIDTLSRLWPDEAMDDVETFWPNSFSNFQKPVPWDEVRAGIKEGGIFGYKEGYNLLHAFVQARNKPAVEFLLYKGNRLRYAFLHAKTKSEGLTPLHLAAQYPDAEIFELLLINGADSQATDKNGVSPWAMAIKAGNEELVNLLIAVVPETLNHLISTGTGRPLKPIAYAIECHNKGLVNLLLDRQAEIEGMDGAGNTPLMTALQVKDLEIATILINKGADILATNERKETPLIIALKTKSDEIFNFILEKQPEIETKTVDNETALLIATRMGKLTMVEALLEKGADPMSDYEPGASPLDVARAAKHTGIMKLLYEARATRKTGARQRYQYDDELDRKVKAELAKEKKDKLKVDRAGDFNYKLSKGGLRYGSK